MDRLNYHHLYIFWTLAREGTFTKTSEKLGIAQSAVTSQIKQLENILGLMLIDRSNRRKPILTEEGKMVFEYATSIFESGAELLKWAKLGIRPSKQNIRIGAISGLSRNFQYEFMKPLVGRSDVSVTVTTGDQEKLVRLLKEHGLDLILSSHNVSAEGRIEFHSHVLTSSPIIFVISADQAKKELDIKKMLMQKPLYLPGQSFEARPELDAHIESLRTQFNVAGEIDDIALLRVFALQSGAIVAIPEMGVTKELKSKELVLIAKANGIFQRFYAITRQRKFPSPLVAELVLGIQNK